MRRTLIYLITAGLALGADTINGYVPNVDTTVVASTVRIGAMGFQMTTGTSATITIKDLSTACASGPCTLLIIPLTTAAANAQGTLNGRLSPGGFTWSANCSSCVVGWIQYGPYQQYPQ